MPYDFAIDQERQLIGVRYSGVVTLEERRAAAQHVLGEAASPDMRRILLDYRPATSLARDEAAADALVDYLARTLGERRARVAWLVNYDHQLHPLVEGKLREGGIATARFHDPDAALAWLQKDDAPPVAAAAPAPAAKALPSAPDTDAPPTPDDAPTRASAAGRKRNAPDPSFALGLVLGASHPARARGMFEVKVAPQSPDNPPAQGAGLARLSLDKRYRGPLDAIGQGEMLAEGGGNRKDGAYVAMERVTGTLQGRKGSFALVHRALMRDGTPQEWTVAVVPGSGTDALAGLEGSLRITIEQGMHFYDLEYSLPD